MALHFFNKKLDPDLNIISFNKKHFRPEIEKAVPYVWDITVLPFQPVCSVSDFAAYWFDHTMKLYLRN